LTATPIEDAKVVYEPDADFAGEDGLDYKITNPIGQAAECHVRFEVVAQRRFSKSRQMPPHVRSLLSEEPLE